jgi:hypothetical protein
VVSSVPSYTLRAGQTVYPGVLIESADSTAPLDFLPPAEGVCGQEGQAKGDSHPCLGRNRYQQGVNQKNCNEEKRDRRKYGCYLDLPFGHERPPSEPVQQHGISAGLPQNPVVARERNGCMQLCRILHLVGSPHCHPFRSGPRQRLEAAPGSVLEGPLGTALATQSLARPPSASRGRCTGPPGRRLRPMLLGGARASSTRGHVAQPSRLAALPRISTGLRRGDRGGAAR